MNGIATGAGWTAGAAQRALPAPPGTPLAGYAARGGPSEGTLDELTVGALALERNGNRFVVVAADVVAVDEDLAAEVAGAAGLRRDEILVAASHTHSGPAGIVARLHPASPDELDRGRRAVFVEVAAAAISAARHGAEPVDLVFGQAPVDGVVANRNDPAGPRDDRVGVVATRRQDGSVQAALVHLACHPTVLGADNRLVSADFPGALRVHLAASANGRRRPVVLFANGAAGDISTRFTRRGQDAAEVDRIGALVARAAAEALRTARILGPGYARGREAVPLTPRGVGLAAVKRPDPDPGGGRIAETRAQGAALLAALAADPAAVVPTTLDIVGWAIGELVLVAVPGELFASLGRSIAAARNGPTLVLGYANGHVGYLPDRAAFASGTYEALASPYGPGCGETVAAAAAGLAARLGSGARS